MDIGTVARPPSGFTPLAGKPDGGGVAETIQASRSGQMRGVMSIDPLMTLIVAAGAVSGMSGYALAKGGSPADRLMMAAGFGATGAAAMTIALGVGLLA